MLELQGGSLVRGYALFAVKFMKICKRIGPDNVRYHTLHNFIITKINPRAPFNAGHTPVTL